MDKIVTHPACANDNGHALTPVAAHRPWAWGDTGIVECAGKKYVGAVLHTRADYTEGTYEVLIHTARGAHWYRAADIQPPSPCQQGA